MSTSHGPLKWFSSSDLLRLATESPSTLARKQSKNELRCRAVARQVSLLPNSTQRRSTLWRLQAIVSSWLSTRPWAELLQLTESSLSTQLNARVLRELAIDDGIAQRDSRGPVQPLPPETPGDEGTPTGSTTRK